jgi:hypothetical protein
MQNNYRITQWLAVAHAFTSLRNGCITVTRVPSDSVPAPRAIPGQGEGASPVGLTEGRA